MGQRRRQRRWLAFSIVIFLLTFFRLPPAIGQIEPKTEWARLHAEGLELYKQERYRDAIRVWVQEALLDPANANTINNLGIAYSKLHSFEDDREYHKSATELDSRFGHAYYSLGLAYLELEALHGAEKAFERAAELFYTPGVSYYNLGLVYTRLQLWKKAAGVFKKHFSSDTPTRGLANMVSQMLTFAAMNTTRISE